MNIVDEPSLVSATVLLRPARGRRPDAGGATAETVSEYAPDPGATEVARAFFAEQGFELGPAVANTFSITGSAGLFETTFSQPVEREQRGPVTTFRTASGSRELALSALPDRAARHLETVVFSRPLDFGPGTF